MGFVMRVEILAIGTELVSGAKTDTNSGWLARRLGDLGLTARFITLLGDDHADNLDAFRTAAARSDVVLTTGGLGPTQDDLTREIVAELRGVPLIEDRDSLEAIRGFFARLNRTMSPRNAVQALVPEDCRPIPNPVGTAPGIWAPPRPNDPQVRAAFVCLPGVPHEMKTMFDERVIPLLRDAFPQAFGSNVLTTRLNLFGRGESEIESQALDLTMRGRNPDVGITASDGLISFHIRSFGSTEAEARQRLEADRQEIQRRFADFLVGEGSEELPHAVARLLAERKVTLALAESCTGGMISTELTAIPGISAHYLGGLVTYANAAKTQLLGVPTSLLEIHGAVSEPVARAMAEGVRLRLGADLGLSVTGIAGPGGGSHEKPVGLVWFGLATSQGSIAHRSEIGPEKPRDIIRKRAVRIALDLVRRHLRSSADPHRPPQTNDLASSSS